MNDLESDSAGNIYVSDSGDLKGTGGVVYKVTPQGKVSTVVTGKKDNRVQAPNGLLMGKCISHNIKIFDNIKNLRPENLDFNFYYKLVDLIKSIP